MKTVLFLYTELAEYFLACLEELKGKGYAVHVVRWPVNQEAPFQFRSLDDITFYTRNDYSDDQLQELVDSIQPDILLTSGWVDKGYLAVNQRYRGQIPTVLLLDNHWTGSWKQQVARRLSKWLIHRYFSHAWVPGEYQHRFAQKMGFNEQHIRHGFYCADTSLFDDIFKRRQGELERAPKRLLYVGRYLEFKGIFELWESFINLHNDGFDDWELWCAGTGHLWDQRMEHPAIQHFGFVQPDKLEELIQGSAAFVMPSRREPWGVVLHEMAAAGLPLICSTAVGAATRFIREGENGFFHAPGNQQELQQVMRQMMTLSSEARGAMSHKSHEMARSLTPRDWTQTLGTLIPE